MDKKYLGIGFVFAALDKGLKNAFRAVSNFVSSTTKGLKDVNVEGEKGTKRGGIWGMLSELGRLGILTKIAGDIGGMNKALLGTKETSDEVVRSLSDQAAEMIFTGVETGKIMDVTNRLRDNVNKLGVAWGTGPVEASELYRKLHSVGFQYKELNKGIAEHNSLIDEAAKLVSVVGVNQEDVTKIYAQGFKTLGYTNDQMKDLLQSTALYQKQFGINKLYENLDEVMKTIVDRKIFEHMGKEEAKEVTKSGLQLVAAFRATGMETNEATGALDSLYSQLGKSKFEFKKLTAGLEADLSGMQDYTLVTGDIGSALDAIQTNDAVTAVSKLRSAVSEAASDPRALDALQTRIYNTFGPDVTKALFVTWNKKAMDIIHQNRQLGKSSEQWAKKTGGAYKELIETQKETIGFSEKAAKAAEDMWKSEMTAMATPKIVKARESMKDAYKTLRESMKGAGATTKWFMEELEVLRVTGVGGLLSQVGLIGPKVIIAGEAFDAFKKHALLPISTVIAGTGDVVRGIREINDARKVVFKKENWEFIYKVGRGMKWLSTQSWEAAKGIWNFAKNVKIASIAQGIWSAAVAVWNAVMALNPIVWIIAGIVALIAVVYLAIKYWDVWTAAVVKFSKWLWNLIETSWIYQKAIKPIIGFIMKLVHWFTGLSDTVLMVISVFFPFIGIPALIIKHWGGMKKWLGDIWDLLYEKGKWAIDGIMGLVDPLLGIFNKIGEGISWVTGKIGKLIGISGEAKAAAAAAAVPATTQEKRDVAKAAVQARVDETAAALPPGMIPGEDRAAVLATRRETTLKALKTKPQKDVMTEMVKAIYDIGSEIVNAVQSGMSVNVELVGDAKKFIRVSSAQSNAAMMRTGAGAQIGG